MPEGVNGGPARFYRRRSLAEQREAFQIATAEVAILEAKAEQVTTDAEVRINKLDLPITDTEAGTAGIESRREEASSPEYTTARCSWGQLKKRKFMYAKSLS